MRGVISFSPVIYFALWIKLFILVMILVTAGVILTSSINLLPENLFSRTVHIIWFMPKVISTRAAEAGLLRTKNFFKVTDRT